MEVTAARVVMIFQNNRKVPPIYCTVEPQNLSRYLIEVCTITLCLNVDVFEYKKFISINLITLFYKGRQENDHYRAIDN